jgi:hypothetical protein
MPLPAPTAAPPSFYDNLPAGGDAAAGGPPPPAPGGKQGGDSDVDGELMKGLTGVYRVLSKMGKLKKEIKPGIDKIKEDIKGLVVQGLKKDPKDLDSGEEKTPDAAPAPDAAPPAGGPPSPPPSQTDESHAA